MADLRTGFATHEGQVRNQNEDNLHVGPGLFIVADGMGGHQAGEIASEMAVTRLRDRLGDDAPHTIGDLVDAVTEANHDIYRSSVEQPDRNGMGTTVTALAVTLDPYEGEMLAVANVGDSRTYLVRHGRLRQVTIDHSLVQEMVAEGAITRDEARHHPRRNIVTRALGIGPSTRVDSWPVPLIRGDRFVLCSDGLVDEVHDDDIADILASHPDDPQAAADALVDAANAAGGRDNITVVVVDVLTGDEPPEPTEEIEVIPAWGADLDVTGEHPAPTTTDPVAADHEPAAADAPADDTEPAEPAGSPGDAGDGSGTPPDGARRLRPSGQFARFLIVMGVSAVVVLGVAILAAWARQGYYVAFDDDGDVVIYQGRDLLWFQPTAEAPGPYGRDVLDDESIALVEARPTFESQASAAQFVASRLTPTTTTTTTTVPSTTVPSTTSIATTTTVPRTTTTTATSTTTGTATTTTGG